MVESARPANTSSTLQYINLIYKKFLDTLLKAHPFVDSIEESVITIARKSPNGKAP